MSAAAGGRLHSPMPPFPPALPQGSELLRDPSLGAQLRVHLVKMIILTQPEVGAEPEARSRRKARLCPVGPSPAVPQGLRVTAGLPASQTQPRSQLCPPLGTAEPRFPPL